MTSFNINTNIAASAAQSMHQSTDVAKKRNADKNRRAREDQAVAERSDRDDAIFDENLKVQTENMQVQEEAHSKLDQQTPTAASAPARTYSAPQGDDEKVEAVDINEKLADGQLNLLDTEASLKPRRIKRLDLEA